MAPIIHEPKSELPVLDSDSRIDYLELSFETELYLPPSASPLDGNTPEKIPRFDRYTAPDKLSASRKNGMLRVACIATIFASFAASSYSPGAEQMAEEFHASRVAVMVGITSFNMGFAIVPIALAPFSELRGRKPVFLASGAVFLVRNVCCAVTPTYAYGGMLASRSFAGVGSSTFSTRVGGLFANIYFLEDRNCPMALSSGTAVLGVGLGPLVAGFVAEATTWRWIFHVQTVVIGAILTVMAICFVETRADVVLRRKMLALNQWYDAHEQAGHFDHYHSPSSMLPQRKLQANGTAPPPASFGKQVAISLARPFRLLLTDPVVFFFSLWTAFSWWVLYICLSSVPLVFERSHRFDLAQANAVFVNSS